MIESTDDKIQQALEQGLPLPADPEQSPEMETGAAIYRQLFEGLKMEADGPVNLRLLKTVHRKIRWISLKKAILFTASAALIVLLSMAGIFYLLRFLDQKSATEFSAFVTRHSGVLAYLLILVPAIQYRDENRLHHHPG